MDSLEQINGVLGRYEYFNYVYTDEDKFTDDMLNELFKEGWFGIVV